MDPQLEKSPGLALPQPSVERGVDALPPYQTPGRHSPEAAPAAPEAAFQPAAPSFAVPAAMPVPLSPTLPLPQPPATQPAAATSPTAADDDALDQEWVNKAKAIVERTKNDPFTESREISRAKADYLRTRYNKHIKVAEERAQ